MQYCENTLYRLVSDQAYDLKPTYDQAVVEYRRQYDDGTIEVILLPGSKWALAVAALEKQHTAALKVEYEDLEYNKEVELALREMEARAAAEKAYNEVMKAHGFA
ncbi:uncharacterized protein ARMOST_19247 [Armillaria ostoyae]|uniref:Uncharacterized protein n=1 Tax=Armillaria ostoyae TaxID=47428 RepID=A0A284S404_ARMOS|nr:uncharacterized protein ARMOST_19247 [Armillaria ostoyae]